MVICRGFASVGNTERLPGHVHVHTFGVLPGDTNADFLLNLELIDATKNRYDTR